MDVADVTAGVVLAAAVYEAAAIWTRRVPTITDLLYRTPRVARAGLVALAALWAIDHFEVL